MRDIRCGNCNKKLGAGEYTRLNIKCPRCKALNQLSAGSADPEHHRVPSGVKQYDKSYRPLDGWKTQVGG